MICPFDSSRSLRIRRRRIHERFTITYLPKLKKGQYDLFLPIRFVANAIFALFTDYDVIHCYTVAFPWIGLPGYLGKLRGKFLVADWNDLWGKGGLASGNPLLFRKLMEASEVEFARKAHRLTVVSDYLANYSVRLGISRHDITKVPHGSELLDFQPVQKETARARLGLPDGPIALSVGSNTPGFAFMLEAFGEACRAVNSARLLLLGKIEPAYSEVISDINKDPSNHIEIVGVRLGYTFFLWLSAADVLIMPMDNSPNEWARLPIRLVDFMAAGRPIVSNAVGEVRRVLTANRCGLVSPVGAKSLMASNIIELFNNPHLANSIGKAGRETAKRNYSWHEIACRISNLYQGLLGDSGSDSSSR